MSASKARPKAAGSVRADAARDVAAIVDGGTSLADCYGRWAKRGGTQTALLRALVTDTVRWHFRLQWQLNQLLDKPLPKKDAELAALLRIGLMQLQFMRVPEHAAVDETVEAAAKIRRRHARGLINAVLRRFLREREQLDAAMQDDDEARTAHPQWLIDAIRADWPQDAEQIFAAANTAPPMWLRINTTRVSIDAYHDLLSAADIGFTTDDALPAAVRLDAPMRSAELPGFADGLISVQDRSAQLAPTWLDLAPGQRVLDACAAPGGKTAAMLEAQPQLGKVLAIDRDPQRLVSLRASLTRLGHDVYVQCADAAEASSWWDGQPFDRILLDAPCTATGVIRRHPDIRLRRSEAALENAQQQQIQLLNALWPLLRAGGRLLYVTCSVLHRENAAQVQQFLQQCSDAVPGQARQYLPGEADGDGFYYACLKKQA